MTTSEIIYTVIKEDMGIEKATVLAWWLAVHCAD